MNKNIKMRLFGLFLIIAGAGVLIYSVLFSSSTIAFWTIYIGLMLLIAGLGLLGFNVGGYPF